MIAESKAPMNNPFGPEQIPGSYIDLRKRMFQYIQSLKIRDQISMIVQNAYEQALAREQVVLSRPERVRLFSEIKKMVLEDMIKNIGQDSHPA